MEQTLRKLSPQNGRRRTIVTKIRLPKRMRRMLLSRTSKSTHPIKKQKSPRLEHRKFTRRLNNKKLLFSSKLFEFVCFPEAFTAL
jgi:hypothetical protein